jgi:hypothetical protein
VRGQQFTAVGRGTGFLRDLACVCIGGCRYKELKTSPESIESCPACTSVCHGLIVGEKGSLTLSESLLRHEPFSSIAEVKQSELERVPTLLEGSCGCGAPL